MKGFIIYAFRLMWMTMTFEEKYLKLIGQIDNFVQMNAGTSIVDSYFGPANLSPKRVEPCLTVDELIENIDTLYGQTKGLENELRRIVIASELESLRVVVRWLSGEIIPYSRLVKGIFGITPCKFKEREIRRAQKKVEEASASLPGSSISEKILRWMKNGEVSGKVLKELVETELAELTRKIEKLFDQHVFTYFPTGVQNKGVIYKTVTKKPWGANNYYQGNYTSITAINIDLPANRRRIMGGLCHEYEHHVTNLFREKHYRENKLLDLSAVLYHTKGSVIDEGTADCAKDFLNLQTEEEHSELLEYLQNLRRMIDINVAYMINVQGVDDETAAEYIASESFAPIEAARKLLEFIKPMTPNGKPNFFKPYIYTYFFGRRDYVLPTFQEAQKKNRLKEFFQILYLNPYSRSTASWKIAFAKI